MKDTKTILFRASGVGALMVNPRSKAAKEAGELSETAKTFIQDQWLHDKYRYREPMITPQMFKGLLCEQDAIEVMQNQLPSLDFRMKNTKFFKNDFFCGTPDVVLNTESIVEDAKCSWTLKTFFGADVSTLYYTQLQVYMNLTGCFKARLCYVLVNTPEVILEDEINRLAYKFGRDEDNPYYQKCLEQLLHIHTPEYIEEEKRIKVFEFDYDPAHIEELQSRVERAREYYNSLTL